MGLQVKKQQVIVRPAGDELQAVTLQLSRQQLAILQYVL